VATPTMPGMGDFLSSDAILFLERASGTSGPRSSDGSEALNLQ
jgi:hypothetical protein